MAVHTPNLVFIAAFFSVFSLSQRSLKRYRRAPFSRFDFPSSFSSGLALALAVLAEDMVEAAIAKGWTKPVLLAVVQTRWPEAIGVGFVMFAMFRWYGPAVKRMRMKMKTRSVSDTQPF